MLIAIKIITIITTIKNVHDYLVWYYYIGLYSLSVFISAAIFLCSLDLEHVYYLCSMDGMSSYCSYPIACYSLDEVELPVVRLWVTLFTGLISSFTQLGLVLSFDTLLEASLCPARSYSVVHLFTGCHNTMDYYDSTKDYSLLMEPYGEENWQESEASLYWNSIEFKGDISWSTIDYSDFALALIEVALDWHSNGDFAYYWH